MPLAVFVPASLDDLAGNVQTEPAPRGSVIYKGGNFWNSLAPGTAGQVLTSGGAGADPSWTTPTGGGGGAVLLAPNTPTVNTIVPTADANTGLIVQAHAATQSASLIETRAADGTVTSRFDPAGGLFIQPSTLENCLQCMESAAPGGSSLFAMSRRDGSNLFAITSSGFGGSYSFSVYQDDPGPLIYAEAAQTSPLLSAIRLDSFLNFNPLSEIDLMPDGSLQCLAATSVLGTARRQAALVPTWVDNTDGAQKGRLTLHAADAGASREGLRIEADGANPRLGFFGQAAVVRPTLSAAATDLASCIALANSLRSAQIALGLGA